MLPADYHMHHPLCRHATGVPTELAARAVQAGLSEIGFSDHSPMPQDDYDDWRMHRAELPTYLADIEKARREHPRLTIRVALEVDYLPGCESWVHELAGLYPWDYFIGSVHYISGGFAIDSPFQMSEWRKRDPMEVWTAYFDRLAQAAQSGLFQIIGHADLCKKFCFYPKEDVTPLFENFLTAARRGNVAIELNTAGLRKDCKEIYPSERLLRMAHAAGVPITFGSDAHSPGEVGANFPEAVALAKACGYRDWCRFSRRERSLVPL